MISEVQIGQQSEIENMEVFRILYDKYAPCLNGLIIKLTPDSFTASRILQESFVTMWTQRKTYNKSRERVFTWMFSIVLKHCAEVLDTPGKELVAKLNVARKGK